MPVAREKDYRETESVKRAFMSINDSEYSDLKQLESADTNSVRGLEYLDIYDGDSMDSSALTARVIAGEQEPYHMTATYNKLSEGDVNRDLLEPIEEIVSDLEIDNLLE